MLNYQKVMFRLFVKSIKIKKVSINILRIYLA